MRTYIVLEPAATARSLAAAERILFLREKFSWTALLLAPLWLLAHRLWIGFATWIAAVALIVIAGLVLELDRRVIAIASFIPAIVLGFEATELRRRKLVRRGYRDAGVIVAADLDEAERRFFQDWIDKPPPTAPLARSVPAGERASAPQEIIGLFPEAGGRP